MTARGAEIKHAENGKIALKMFESSAPGYCEAILMDVRMPEMRTDLGSGSGRGKLRGRWMNMTYLFLLGCSVCGIVLSLIFEHYWKKTKSAVFRIPYAAVYGMLAGLLCVQVVGIYQEGMARRAENPMASIYTPEIVAEKLSPLSPLFFIAVGLVIGGLLAGAKEKSAGKPVGAKPKTDRRQTRPGVVQASVIAAAIVFILLGIFNGSALDVLTKAINICSECIGLG